MTPEELDARAHAEIGRVLRGKWRLDKVLGVGGMASVFAGTHRNGMRGAVKVLHPELALSFDVRDRFLREGYVANRVDHPGAVRVLDDDVDQGAVFLVMELLEGRTVESIALRSPSQLLPLRVAIDVGLQVLETLAAAHAHGIVHRDIKPENLFFTEAGRVKVLDFGIARLLDAPGNSKATKTGHFMGTPAFMPPEQARGKWSLVDARSDLYAVGASLFTLLTGRMVHEGETANEVLLSAMTVPVKKLSEVRPDLPLGLGEVIDRALAFDPDARFPDATSMREALRDALEAVPTTSAYHAPAAVTARGSAPAPEAVTTSPSGVVVAEQELPETMAAPPNPASKGRRRAALRVGGAIAALAAVTLTLTLSLRGAADVGAPEAPSPKPLAAAAGVDLVPSPPATATSATSATSVVAEAPKVVATSAPALAAAPRPAAKKPTAPPSANGRAGCDPPFYVDSNGFKHAKPNCF